MGEAGGGAAGLPSRPRPRLTGISLKRLLYATTVELAAVLLALLLSRSMDRSAVLLGYSPARLAMIVLAGGLLAVSGTLAWRARAGRLPAEVNLAPNVRLAVRDLLVAGTVGVFGLLALSAYSPKFLGFLWGPLPAVIERGLPLLWFGGVFCLQGLALLAWPGVQRDWRGPLRAFAARLLPPVAVFLVLLGVFRVSAARTGLQNPNIAYFPALAEAFLDGRLHLDDPPVIKDLSLFEGRYYVAFPPLAALLFLPTVAAHTRFGVDTIAFSGVAAAAGGAALFVALRALDRRRWAEIGRWQSAAVAIGISLGTPLLYMTTTGAVWHISQVLAFLFLSLAIAIALSDDSDFPWANFRTALLAGLAMGLAMLARPHLAVAGIFLLAAVYQRLGEQGNRNWNRLLGWGGVYALPGALAAAGLLWYNAARFGDPLDFGYSYMLVGPELVEPLALYGQFHPHFILQNLRANWFGMPYWHAACRRPMPSAQGLSLFLTTPIVLYAGRTFRSIRPWLAGAWVAVAAIAGLHLLYFNTGAHQFGYRFSVDFMPILACILAAALPRRWTWVPVTLIIYGIGVNFVGVLWNAKLFCDTW